ncbi:G2/mitotic-specific cyclin-1 isoform X1 [Capsicum annuum]|uniref:G2/mitotic-specific cyclin-1 isoform X1 n=1 Tax=Capsicum annuum TaxID=4072 RepID=UPI001FB07FC4|nr:G2/mitotic-specific cyclin-1 isoform X1 [Capsicum annuum]
MAITDENKSTMIKNSNGQVKGKGDMSTRKFGGVERRNNRRVWGMINQNLVGGNGYPCVVNRGLSGANGIAGKNLPVRAHRPIIRGFAAQVANSQQRCSEMLRKMKQLKISLSLCLWEKLKLRQMFLFPFLRTQIGFCKNVIKATSPLAYPISFP